MTLEGDVHKIKILKPLASFSSIIYNSTFVSSLARDPPYITTIKQPKNNVQRDLSPSLKELDQNFIRQIQR